MPEDTIHLSVSLLAEALRAHGVKPTAFVLDGLDYTRFTAPSGRVWLVDNYHINYPFTSGTIQNISKHKNLAYELAVQAGVPVPKTTKVTAMPAPEELEALLADAPLVVKPNSASLSNGMTLNIRDAATLITAIEAAFVFADTILIQTQAEGEEIRMVVANGKAKAALLREAPKLHGDGVSTVKQLLEAENDARSALKMPYLNYPQLDGDIIDLEKLNMDTVPVAGEAVTLGRGTMIRGGASVYNIIDRIDDSYKQTAETLALVLGSDFIVVDMIIQDFTQPCDIRNHVFLEFNCAPVLKLFYSCRDGLHYDVMEELVPLILKHLEVK